MDGSTTDVPDSEKNHAFFGRPSNQSRDGRSRRPGEPSVTNVSRRIQFHLLYQLKARPLGRSAVITGTGGGTATGKPSAWSKRTY